MKLYVNERIFSIRKKFYIKDENDNDIYEISNKIISFGDKTTITDMQGNVVAYIEQKVLNISPHYKVYINDEFSYEITKKINPFKNDYVLGNGYKVDGGCMNLNFIVYDNNNNQVGSIHKKLVSVGDKYEITIDDETKKEIVLSIIVAIANDVNRSQND